MSEHRYPTTVEPAGPEMFMSRVRQDARTGKKVLVDDYRDRLVYVNSRTAVSEYLNDFRVRQFAEVGRIDGGGERVTSTSVAWLPFRDKSGLVMWSSFFHGGAVIACQESQRLTKVVKSLENAIATPRNAHVALVNFGDRLDYSELTENSSAHLKMSHIFHCDDAVELVRSIDSAQGSIEELCNASGFVEPPCRPYSFFVISLDDDEVSSLVDESNYEMTRRVLARGSSVRIPVFFIVHDVSNAVKKLIEMSPWSMMLDSLFHNHAVEMMDLTQVYQSNDVRYAPIGVLQDHLDLSGNDTYIRRIYDINPELSETTLSIEKKHAEDEQRYQRLLAFLSDEDESQEDDSHD